MKKAIMFSTAICVLCFVLGVEVAWFWSQVWAELRNWLKINRRFSFKNKDGVFR